MPKRRSRSTEESPAAAQPTADVAPDGVLPLEAVPFRRALRHWYQRHARELPWRGVHDPYFTWLSEIMLQQTRVATVIERFRAFTERFPSVAELAAAEEDDVLALWSGLGYYRRARMLHRGAQFVVRELDGHLPRTAPELRTLPGIGEYTSAAIASIAFGESVAVLDGNVERVLLRLLGLPGVSGAEAREHLMSVAQGLMPQACRPPRGVREVQLAAETAGQERARRSLLGVKGAATPMQPSPGLRADGWTNLPGDHNQAMMELGATVCLPRGPLCLECPAMRFCRTRGEHPTAERKAPRSRRVAYLLAIRKRGVATEVLLARRPEETSLMPGMLELPPLPLDAVEGREPVLRLRHSITDTNYYVEVYSESAKAAEAAEAWLFDDPERVLGPALEPSEDERVFEAPEAERPALHGLAEQAPVAATDLRWSAASRLNDLPLTGLARKALIRLGVMVLPTPRR